MSCPATGDSILPFNIVPIKAVKTPVTSVMRRMCALHRLYVTFSSTIKIKDSLRLGDLVLNGLTPKRRYRLTHCRLFHYS